MNQNTSAPCRGDQTGEFSEDFCLEHDQSIFACARQFRLNAQEELAAREKLAADVLEVVDNELRPAVAEAQDAFVRERTINKALRAKIEEQADEIAAYASVLQDDDEEFLKLQDQLEKDSEAFELTTKVLDMCTAKILEQKAEIEALQDLAGRLLAKDIAEALQDSLDAEFLEFMLYGRPAPSYADTIPLYGKSILENLPLTPSTTKESESPMLDDALDAPDVARLGEELKDKGKDPLEGIF